MTDDGTTLAIPRFDRHNGKTAKNRALTAKRVAKHKAKNGNEEVTHDALPREEKRRVLPPNPQEGKRATSLSDGFSQKILTKARGKNSNSIAKKSASHSQTRPGQKTRTS